MWGVAVIILVNIAEYTSGQEHGWTYNDESSWPGVCTTGRLQSPINIISADAVVDKNQVVIRGPLMLRGFTQVNVGAVNDGHTCKDVAMYNTEVKWSLEKNEPSPIVFGGPLRGNYSFLQFHLHWLSEHAIDGMKYPMEIHLVHMKTGLTVDEALKRPDGLAVIAVLCKVNSGRESEVALEEIAPAFPLLIERGVGYANATVIDVTRLLSSEIQSFYTYHGSLTTPQCQEVVTWIVMDKPISISDTQYKQISKVDVGGVNNFRSLQPVNRVVTRSLASCATVTVPTTLGLLAGLVNFSTSLGTTVSRGICALANLKRKFFGNQITQCIL